MVDFLYTWLFGDWIQFIGFLTGGGAVFFLARNNGLVGWTLGVINSVFFGIMFFGEMLLADFTLNLYYFFTSGAGLFWWIKLERDRRRGIEVGAKKKETISTISHLDGRAWMRWIAIWVAASAGMGFVLDTFTPADIAYLDSFTTVGSLIGQYLLVRKVFENWYIWIFVDVLDIGIYAYKGLFPVVVLTVIYMVLCVVGIITWRRVERGEAVDITRLEAAEAAAA